MESIVLDIFFFKQKTAYEILAWLEFSRVLFRSIRSESKSIGIQPVDVEDIDACKLKSLMPYKDLYKFFCLMISNSDKVDVSAPIATNAADDNNTHSIRYWNYGVHYPLKFNFWILVLILAFHIAVSKFIIKLCNGKFKSSICSFFSSIWKVSSKPMVVPFWYQNLYSDFTYKMSYWQWLPWKHCSDFVKIVRLFWAETENKGTSFEHNHCSKQRFLRERRVILRTE